MSGGDPDWVLFRRITRIVTSAPGRGMHRAELAERSGVPAYAGNYKTALMVAYRKKLIDFCGQYVVAPPKVTRPDPGQDPAQSSPASVQPALTAEPTATRRGG